MPDFRLTDGEAAGLAKYLRASSKGRLAAADLSTGNAQRGRTAYREQGCQACHAVTANAQPHRGEPISLGDDAASRGCLAIAPAAAAVDYQLSREDRAALSAFVTSDKQSLMTCVPPEASRRLVQSLRCTACHGRDGQASDLSEVILSEGVQGLPPQAIPALTWAGEKLRREWTSTLLGGDILYRARPWLAARMPAFPAYAESLAAGLPAEHGFSGRLDHDPDSQRTWPGSAAN